MTTTTDATTTILLAYGQDASGDGGYLERVSIDLAHLAIQAGIATPAIASEQDALTAYTAR